MDMQVKYMSAGKIVSRCSDFFPQSKDMLIKLIGCMSLWVSPVIDSRPSLWLYDSLDRFQPLS